MYTGKVHEDFISVALGNHVLNFLYALKHGDGNLECFVLCEKGNPKYLELKHTVVTGCPNGFTGIVGKYYSDYMNSVGFNQQEC